MQLDEPQKSCIKSKISLSIYEKLIIILTLGYREERTNRQSNKTSNNNKKRLKYAQFSSKTVYNAKAKSQEKKKQEVGDNYTQYKHEIKNPKNQKKKQLWAH